MGSERFWRSLLLIPFLFVSSLFATDLQPVTITDFSAGLQTTRDSSQIDVNASPDLQNVDVWTGRVTKRRGSVLQNSTVLGGFSSQPVRFLHEFPDANGTFWLIAASSATTFKSNDGGTNWTTLTSTYGFTTSSQFSATNAFGKTRLTDGTTNWVVFDGSNVTVSTSSPKGKLAEFFAERVWTADISGDRSTLYASSNIDPEDWTDNGLVDSDAFSTPVRRNDGYPIRAIKKFGKGMVILKDFSMDLLTVNPDGNTFQLTPISNTVGTQHPKSVQVVDNEMIFLASDGYYAYDGAQLARISDLIKPTVSSIGQLNSSNASYIETLQSQFQAGTNTNTSPNISAGDVVLSTWTATDTSSSDFAAGTLTNMTTSTVDGALYLSVNNGNVTNNSFESALTSGYEVYSGTGGVGNRATVIPGCDGGTGCSPFSGSFFVYDLTSSASLVVDILDTSNNVIGSNSITLPTNSWQQQTLSMSGYKGRNIKLKFRESGGVTILRSEAFLASGTDIKFYGTWHDDSIGGGPDAISLDLIADGKSTIFTGSFLSQCFDTSISSPAWLSSTPTYTANGNTVGFETQVATSCTGTFDSLVSWTPGSAPTSANKRAIRYKVSVSTTSSSSALPFVSDVALAARSLSGRYLSSPISLTSIASWGQFSTNFTNNEGNVIFELYTDTSAASGINVSNAATFTSSQTITSGSVPTISTAAVAYVASTMTITASTQNPTMSDFTLPWNTGSSNFPVASLVYQSDYLCAVAIDSVTVNDTILVYDRNGNWTKYKDLQAYSMSLYRQKPYYGDSSQGKVFRFQADGILNDNGVAINSYWTSKNFDFGFPITDKTMQSYYVTAQYEVGSDALFSYGVNRGSLTSTTLDLDLYSGFFRKNISPTTFTYQIGMQHRFKISDSDVSQTFNLLSVTMSPRLETSP